MVHHDSPYHYGPGALPPRRMPRLLLDAAGEATAPAYNKRVTVKLITRFTL